jgi:hypothetical protein
MSKKELGKETGVIDLRKNSIFEKKDKVASVPFVFDEKGNRLQEILTEAEDITHQLEKSFQSYDCDQGKGNLVKVDFSSKDSSN